MPNAFFLKVSGEKAILDSAETHHLRVMRSREGDTLTGIDGMGFIYAFVLERISKTEASGRIIKREFIQSDQREIIIAVASTKWPRLRIILEKATELGVDTIELFESKRSVVKLEEEKLTRHEQVIREASKQSVNPYLPEIRLVKKPVLEDAFNILLDFGGTSLNSVSKTLELQRRVRIIVGPEGGFSPEEIREFSSKSTKVSLGRRTLRVETSIIVTLGIINAYTGRM